jgi:hypothetical protein
VRPTCRKLTRSAASQIVLTGPATGQVAYYWDNDSCEWDDQRANGASSLCTASVLVLVKQGDTRLMEIAANVIRQLASSDDVHSSNNQTSSPPLIQVLLDPTTAARIRHYYGVESDRIHLFEPRKTPGYGNDLSADDFIQDPSWSTTRAPMLDADLLDAETCRLWSPEQEALIGSQFSKKTHRGAPASNAASAKLATVFNTPDLVCTIGGDGLLLHAGMLFQGKRFTVALALLRNLRASLVV